MGKIRVYNWPQNRVLWGRGSERPAADIQQKLPLDFLYFLLLQISLHCLAVHFVIACIKLSSVAGENGGSRGERMIRIVKES